MRNYEYLRSMSKSKIKLYYVFLTIVTLFMVAQTIWVGSQHVTYGQMVAQLEVQQQQLSDQQMQLTQQIQQERSIANVSQTAQNQGYVSIAKMVQVPRQTSVALR